MKTGYTEAHHIAVRADLAGIRCRTGARGQRLKLTCHQSKVLHCQVVIRRDSPFKTSQEHVVAQVGVSLCPEFTTSHYMKIIASKARVYDKTHTIKN